jgi:RNA polymerase sigma-70 factor (ECF subfamily)
MDTPSDCQHWSPESYREYLHLLARLRLGGAQRGLISASDIVQETLLKACKHLDQFRGQTDAEWRAYLRRILANSIADAFRDQNQEKVIQHSLDQSSAQIEVWLQDEQRSPSQRAQHEEQLLALAAGLCQLSPDERTAVELRYLQEPRWSLPEIATHLHRPTVKAVASLLARGMEKLRCFLQADNSGTAASSA